MKNIKNEKKINISLRLKEFALAQSVKSSFPKLNNGF